VTFRSSGSGHEFYVDDVVVHELDDLSLTVTPSNEAASRESMTLTPWGTADTMRVDGRDTLAFPTANHVLAAEGTWMGWRRFRHATAWANETLLDCGGATPNELRVARIASTNVVQVWYGDQNDASTATIATATDHCIALTWKAGTCYLYIDGVAAAGFALSSAAAPTLVATGYFNSNAAGALQADVADLGNLFGKRALSSGEIARNYALQRAWILGDV